MFTDRTDAATHLVSLLREHDVEPEVVVALPRGGVPLGRRVADAFSVPLAVVSVKKIGAPFNPEFALGAVTAGGADYVDERTVDRLGIDEARFAVARVRALREARERAASLGLDPARTARLVRGKRVVVVDDGLATGATVRASLAQLTAFGAGSVVVAVPVAAPDSVADLQDEGWEVLAVETPPHFRAVGQFYGSFDQVRDDEVRALLAAAPDERRGPAG